MKNSHYSLEFRPVDIPPYSVHTVILVMVKSHINLHICLILEKKSDQDETRISKMTNVIPKSTELILKKSKNEKFIISK